MDLGNNSNKSLFRLNATMRNNMLLFSSLKDDISSKKDAKTDGGAKSVGATDPISITVG